MNERLDAEVSFIAALPAAQRLPALAAIWPQGAAIVEDLPRRPTALRRCPVDRLRLIFAACPQELLADAVEKDPRRTTRWLWECHEVEQHATTAVTDEAAVFSSSDPVQAIMLMLSLSGEGATPHWGRLATALHRVEDEKVRADLARQACSHLPTYAYGEDLYSAAANVIIVALSAGYDGPLPEGVAAVDHDILRVALEKLPVSQMSPSQVAGLIEAMYQRRGWSAALLGADCQPLIGRLLAAPKVWRDAALAFSAKNFVTWPFVSALLANRAPFSFLDMEGSEAWQVAPLLPAGPARSALAAFALDSGFFSADDPEDEEVFAWVVDDVVLADADVSRRARRAFALLIAVAGHRAGRFHRFDELAVLASAESPADVWRVLGYANRVDLAAECPSMVSLVASVPEVASLFAPKFASVLAAAPASGWQVAWQMAADWPGTANELFDLLSGIAA